MANFDLLGAFLGGALADLILTFPNIIDEGLNNDVEMISWI